MSTNARWRLKIPIASSAFAGWYAFGRLRTFPSSFFGATLLERLTGAGLYPGCRGLRCARAAPEPPVELRGGLPEVVDSRGAGILLFVLTTAG